MTEGTSRIGKASGGLAAQTGAFAFAGKSVARLGFGSMRLTGRGIWGEPGDRSECIAVVRRALELGVALIDTADSYGPYVAEDIIREAAHPYPDALVIATKVGFTRNGPDVIDTPAGPQRLGAAAWPPLGRPEYLRQAALMSMRRLGVEQLDLLQLHRVDPQVPLADQVGELALLREEGKVVEIGLSQVSIDQIEEARSITPIATVQNRFNLVDRSAQPVLDFCAEAGIGFIPWAPAAQGGLPHDGGPLKQIAEAHHATPNQVALAWLLARQNVLPIPGTSRREHLEENVAAAELNLTRDELSQLDSLGT